MNIFKEKFSTKKRKIIDCETKQVYDSVANAARSLQCTSCNVTRNIVHGWKIKGHTLEYLDYWEDMQKIDSDDENYKCII